MSSQSQSADTWNISVARRILTTATVAIGSSRRHNGQYHERRADVKGAFGIGQDKAQWVSTAFLVPPHAPCSRPIGRFAGLACPYIGAMLFFIPIAYQWYGSDIRHAGLRADHQGVSGGLAQPLAMMTMFQIYPPDERGKAMGIFGLVIILAPAVGPYFGGLTVDAFGWRQIFFLPVPVAVLSLLLASVFLKPKNKTEQAPSFDWAGFGLLVIFILSLLIALLMVLPKAGCPLKLFSS